jgi:hypothetical protein
MEVDMKKYLMMFGAAGLLAAMMMVGGCGGGGSDGFYIPPTTTTTTSTSTSTSTTTTTTTTSTTLPPTSGTINVSAPSSSHTDAGTGFATTYVLAAGNYTYTITGFTANDKLVFPLGPKPEISNTNVVPANSLTDGEVKVLQVINASETITVKLIGLTPTIDAKILSVDGAFGNINAALPGGPFGAGTVTQQ